MPFGQMPGQQPLGAAPLPDGGAPEAPQKRIIIRRNSTRKEASASPELASRDEPLGAAMPVVEPRGDREPPALPPPLADGTRQVLVMIPRPTTASSDGFGLDDESVKIPEFGVTIDLPDWYREAQNELRRPPPSWPPQVLIDVGADLQDDGEAGQDEHSGLRRGSKASHDTKSSADTTATGEGKKLSPLQAAIQARQRAAETTADDEKDEKASEAGSPSASKRRASVAQLRKSKLFPYILVVLFSNHVYTSGLKTIRDWASKMQTHFEDTCQMQMRNCISWLARALRTFARTLMVDSHRGLELAPSRGSGLKILDIGGDDLTSRQRLAIRAYVLFDILLTGVETPPPPSQRRTSPSPRGLHSTTTQGAAATHSRALGSINSWWPDSSSQGLCSVACLRVGYALWTGIPALAQIAARGTCRRSGHLYTLAFRSSMTSSGAFTIFQDCRRQQASA